MTCKTRTAPATEVVYIMMSRRDSDTRPGGCGRRFGPSPRPGATRLPTKSTGCRDAARAAGSPAGAGSPFKFRPLMAASGPTADARRGDGLSQSVCGATQAHGLAESRVEVEHDGEPAPTHQCGPLRPCLPASGPLGSTRNGTRRIAALMSAEMGGAFPLSAVVFNHFTLFSLPSCGRANRS